MGLVRTGNFSHDTAVAVSEGVRQAAIAPGATQATARAADIAHYRAALASAKANNGVNAYQFIIALQELGTGGV